MKIFLIAGARPNFMKIAPLYHESKNHPDVDCRIVHTGQHYDYAMSQAFFEDLDLPEPHFFLEAGSGSHAVQTARIMTAFETVCESDRPDLIVVVGDVNSTLACSIVAKKMLIKVAHVEAGLRSFDLAMPEEINRMVTDSISDLFFVTEPSGTENLRREGHSEDKIHFVGNIMIDNLFRQNRKLDEEGGDGFPNAGLKARLERYAFLTLHRPSNVDRKETFAEIVRALNDIANEMPIIFPVHPRTRKMMGEHGLALSENIVQLTPLGFREALFFWRDAAVVLTDSGGLQEETTGLGVPCITLRENTERPVTIDMGTNVLGRTDYESIMRAYRDTMGKKSRDRKSPPLWDGRTAERIWRIMLRR